MLEPGEIDTFDQATACRWNTRNAKSEDRNLLNCDIQLQNMTLCTGGSSGVVVLDGATVQLLKGRRYGIIGRNGVGKTTFLRHIAEKRIAGIYQHLRTVFVDDSSAVETSGSMTALEFLIAQHKERVRWCEALAEATATEECADLDWLHRVHLQLDLLTSDAAESRARRILGGLGINTDIVLKEMSGGWRHRCALAGAVFIEADILLLDEPTNNLDAEAVCFLEAFLTLSSSTLVVVSHDHNFLDAVTTDTIVFENRSLVLYRNQSFYKYLETRAAKLQKHKRMYIAQENRRRRWEKTIATLAARGSTSNIIRSRQKALKIRLGASLDGIRWKLSYMGPRPEIMAPEEEEPFHFELPTDISDAPESAGQEETALIEACNLTFRYSSDSDFVLRVDSLKISISSRIGIIGKNGAGKTTLLSCLAGELHASVRRWEGLRVGIFNQDAAANLQSDQSAVRWMSHRRNLHPRQCESILSAFGLFGTQAETQSMRSLSSGQRTRILLADMLVDKPHILFLDEPTSNLDAETSAALAAGLQAFEGGVVLSSHDAWFADEIVEQYYLLDHGSIVEFEGNFALYRGKIVAKVEAELAPPPKQKPVHHDGNVGKVVRREAAVQPQHCDVPMGHSEESEEPHYEYPSTAWKCRHCGGGHFSHACPIIPKKAEQVPAQATTPPQSMAPKKSPQQSPSKVKMPPLSERATDGGGDWKVAISKSTLRRIKKQGI